MALYKNIHEGIFLRRPNRFIAEVEIDGRIETVHVKNTGRCRELLLPGTAVWLEKADSTQRRTAFDLVTVEKQGRLVNIDSQAPNKVVQPWLLEGKLIADIQELKAEKVFAHSRFDFYGEAGNGKRFWVEVKGVTLEDEQVALFPDAPTPRGARHMDELLAAVAQGYDAYALFVVQMNNCRYFTPHLERDPDFAKSLQLAAKGGVQIVALACEVRPNDLWISHEIPVRLEI